MSGVRYKVFPGAPLAFTEREPSHYTDTAGLPRWCEVYDDFTRQIITSMAEFFVKSPVRSFLSVPLFVLTDQGFDEDTVDPIGVLNIHSSQTGLLKGGGEPLTHFTSIIRPFQIFLVQLLILLHPEYAAVKSLTEVEESGKSDS